MWVFQEINTHPFYHEVKAEYPFLGSGETFIEPAHEDNLTQINENIANMVDKGDPIRYRL